MNASDYLARDAVALRTLAASRECSIDEIVSAAIERMRRVDRVVNCICGETPELVEEARRYAREHLDAPLAGVPFVIKDLGPMFGGTLCEMGSRLARGFRFDTDSEFGRRARRAGLITIGRGTTSEFGLNSTAESVLTGPTRNPWNLERSAGGSSGGSAVAVASGIVPMAHGTDGGGSIRIPAACCGVVGLKVSRGRTPVGPMGSNNMLSVSVINVITRSIRDSALALDVFSGPSPYDYIPFDSDGRYLTAINEVNRSRLRIGLCTAFSDARRVEREYQAAVADLGRMCEAEGHSVFEVTPTFSLDQVIETLGYIFCFTFGNRLQKLADSLGRKVDETTVEAAVRAAAEIGVAIDASRLMKVSSSFNEICMQTAEMFTDMDIMITPTLGHPPPELGVLNSNDEHLSFWDYWDRDHDFAHFNPVFNISGQPALSIPVRIGRDNLPIGLQLVGRYGEEATLLRLAADLERELHFERLSPKIPL
jgi:amidase